MARIPLDKNEALKLFPAASAPARLLRELLSVGGFSTSLAEKHVTLQIAVLRRFVALGHVRRMGPGTQALSIVLARFRPEDTSIDGTALQHVSPYGNSFLFRPPTPESALRGVMKHAGDVAFRELARAVFQGDLPDKALSESLKTLDVGGRAVQLRALAEAARERRK